VLGIGCAHIIAANGMRAWFTKSLATRMQSVGYIFLIIGAMLLALGFVNHHHTLKSFSILIIGMSLLSIVIFASDLPITNVSSLLKRAMAGFSALAGLSSLFGDILSYLRLFALGLAGASLALTFNRIAAHVGSSTLGGHGWILAFLILLLGHTLNFALCLMGGVIHGLRLNYIEFFNWGIKEDGYAYSPLKKEELSHE
jgi:V/A-type H+-transporting ATPase subunit I